jgi:hypothetical protein
VAKCLFSTTNDWVDVIDDDPAPSLSLLLLPYRRPMPDPEDIKDVLRTIELYEDDMVCDSAIIVVETGFDRATVDEVLDYLWRVDRIECRAMGSDGGSEALVGIRRVLDCRERRWGQWGRYQGQP